MTASAIGEVEAAVGPGRTPWRRFAPIPSPPNQEPVSIGFSSLFSGARSMPHILTKCRQKSTLRYRTQFCIYASRWFWSASVAQLDRASDFGSEGCRFKSCRTRQFSSKIGVFPICEVAKKRPRNWFYTWKIRSSVLRIAIADRSTPIQIPEFHKSMQSPLLPFHRLKTRITVLCYATRRRGPVCPTPH